jgi:SAM-dependent methyltransferase
MSDNALRLYYDLAWLWPLWQDAAEYAPWCDHVTEVIRKYSLIPARSLLNMGCGGGKNAYNLKRWFEVTGIDISQPMLDNARALNPDCTFTQADIRDCDLGRQFDCVVVDDAVACMLTLADLSALFATASRHLHPGGVMIVDPDYVKESFRQNTTRVSQLQGPDKPGNLDVTFIYLIRENGRLRVETDRDVNGLFTLEQWRATLRDAGFEVNEEAYEGSDRRDGSPTFACMKPA